MTASFFLNSLVLIKTQADWKQNYHQNIFRQERFLDSTQYLVVGSVFALRKVLWQNAHIFSLVARFAAIRESRSWTRILFLDIMKRLQHLENHSRESTGESISVGQRIHAAR